MQVVTFTEELKLLCSHAKLERDKGCLALISTIKKITDTEEGQSQVKTLEEKLQSYLSQVAKEENWENVFGHIQACKILIESQRYTPDFPTLILPYGLQFLEHEEFRVRISSGELLGAICRVVDTLFYKKCEEVLIGSIKKNLKREIPEDPTINDPKQVFHDSAGWKNLETSMKGLQSIIEGCKEGFLQFMNMDVLNLIFETLKHDNRFVRETGYYLCASLARYGVCSADNSDKEMANLLANHLRIGLADNWSQVRLAASVATRQFFQDFNYEDKIVYFPKLLPPMCLNRYYLAEGVKLYSQESWRLVLGTEGRKYVQLHIKDMVEFYIHQTESDNHAVREAACHCISELSSKIEIDAVKGFVAQLLEALIVCFRDESWPVRDTACVACGKFVEMFPLESKTQLNVLYPLFFDNLFDPIPSVRQGAASALTNVAKAYSGEALDLIFEKVVTGLQSLKSQKADSERYETVSPEPGKYGVVSLKQLHDNDIDRHSNQTMYSCGSLAPKMRGGGCMDHSFKRSSEPWEVADGCLYLIGAISNLEVAHPRVLECIDYIIETTKNRCYTHHLYLFETINKVIPLIAKGLGKRVFKQYIERFFDVIFYTVATEENALARTAASECISSLSQFLGPNILAGRVEQYDPSFMRYLQVR